METQGCAKYTTRKFKQRGTCSSPRPAAHAPSGITLPGTRKADSRTDRWPEAKTAVERASHPPGGPWVRILSAFCHSRLGIASFSSLRWGQRLLTFAEHSISRIFNVLSCIFSLFSLTLVEELTHEKTKVLKSMWQVQSHRVSWGRVKVSVETS